MAVVEAATADVVTTAVGLGRTLRAAGVVVTTDRLQRFVTSLAALDPTVRDDVYWAGRLTLCADREDLGRYDRAFAAYFGGEAPHRRLRSSPATRPLQTLRAVSTDPAVDDEEDEADDDDLRLTASASRVEVLRKRDLASLTAADRELVNRLLAAFALLGAPRRTRRWEPSRRGRLDRHRTVRETLRGLGDPGLLAHQRQRTRPRRVVLLVDVSGSMSAYADALLRFAHVATRGPGRVEAFTMGTRLTRITRELSHRDVDSAMAAVAGVIPDWSGGTRLGDNLRQWLDQWGQRGMARGAVVVVLSDGWERGGADLLGEQMARLHRFAHLVVWANPRKGQVDYQPLVAGMAAALPHVDVFIAGHSLAALERLAKVVAGARDPGAVGAMAS